MAGTGLDWKTVMSSIRAVESLTQIDISENRIDVNGGKALAEMLGSSSNIASLGIG